MVCLIKGGPRRVNHAAVAVGDKIFSFGGKKNRKKENRWFITHKNLNGIRISRC